MKPLRIAVIAFSICAAIATGARSSGKLVSWLYIGEDGKSGKVVYYPEGACDPEMPIECETMGIACEGGELRLEVTSLSPADVRRWFRDGDPTAKIVGLETVVELHAASFELSDLSGDWDATFAPTPSGGPWWPQTTSAKSITLVLPDRKLPLPLAVDDRANLAKLASICTSA